MEMDTTTNDTVPEEDKDNCSTNSVDSGKNFYYELKRVNKATAFFGGCGSHRCTKCWHVKIGFDMVSYEYSFDIEFDNYLVYLFLL